MVKLVHSADLNQIAGALEIQLKRHVLTTALAGGFFLKLYFNQNRVFNRIVHPTYVEALNTEGNRHEK